MSVRVGIVGCGLTGRRRAAALAGARLTACADIDRSRADALAQSQPGVRAVTRWEELVGDADLDVVIVATTNDALAGVSVAAIEAGKHVLVEKPAGRTVAEIDRIAGAARRHGRIVRVGFNHRYHPAFVAARRIIDAGTIGPLMFVRGRYGHGGRVGYDREWRADPARSGGGELIDQGMHLIDLSRWLLGPFADVDGAAHTYFWDMAVDDNAFLRLTTPAGQVAFLHVSCTEWKNLFSFEIRGDQGAIHVEGLGGSYGEESLVLTRRAQPGAEAGTERLTFADGDTSWAAEWEDFATALHGGRLRHGIPDEGLQVLATVDALYAAARSGSAIAIQPAPTAARDMLAR